MQQIIAVKVGETMWQRTAISVELAIHVVAASTLNVTAFHQFEYKVCGQ